MIEVCDLSKRYTGRYAVSDISFSADKGEVVGLLGPNGAGKSTIMNIMTGYLSATSGYVKIHGYDILEEPVLAKKHIGYLPEIPPLYPEMTIKEYLDFIFDLKKVKLPKAEHLSEICDQVQITSMKNRLIRNLSKGYKQRVGLAQAMIGNPDVLILDEPTVGLDPRQIIDIRTLIQNLGEKYTVIISSHILSEIQAVCQRIIVLNQGGIVANGTPDELAKQFNSDSTIHLRIKGAESDIEKSIKDMPSVSKVTTYGQLESGCYDFSVEPLDGEDIREKLFNKMAEDKYPIMSMESRALSLEEVFLKLTALGSIDDQNESKSDEDTQTGDDDNNNDIDPSEDTEDEKSDVINDEKGEE